MSPQDIGSFVAQPESETLLDQSREEERDCSLTFKKDFNSTPSGPQQTNQRKPVVPIQKKIPKIALNFTKWRLQKQMVVDLKELKDPQEVQKKLLKYTQCFELLEKLGADNCIDPDDFDEEDIEDELFKNLEITDIWELFNEDENPTASDLYNQTPVGP